VTDELTAHGPDEDPPPTATDGAPAASLPEGQGAAADDAHRALVSAEPARHRDLAALTGLARLAIHEFRLAPGERRPIPAELLVGKAEAFLYVVAGSGALETGPDTRTIGAGDFLGIGAPAAPAAPMTLANTGAGPLICLQGSGG
jgi:uncharacterized cupin superfamily protein